MPLLECLITNFIPYSVPISVVTMPASRVGYILILTRVVEASYVSSDNKRLQLRKVIGVEEMRRMLWLAWILILRKRDSCSG